MKVKIYFVPLMDAMKNRYWGKYTRLVRSQISKCQRNSFMEYIWLTSVRTLQLPERRGSTIFSFGPNQVGILLVAGFSQTIHSARQLYRNRHVDPVQEIQRKADLIRSNFKIICSTFSNQILRLHVQKGERRISLDTFFNIVRIAIFLDIQICKTIY